jgi:hypothetical protein
MQSLQPAHAVVVPTGVDDPWGDSKIVALLID